MKKPKSKVDKPITAYKGARNNKGKSLKPLCPVPSLYSDDEGYESEATVTSFTVQQPIVSASIRVQPESKTDNSSLSNLALSQPAPAWTLEEPPVPLDTNRFNTLEKRGQLSFATHEGISEIMSMVANPQEPFFIQDSIRKLLTDGSKQIKTHYSFVTNEHLSFLYLGMAPELDVRPYLSNQYGSGGRAVFNALTKLRSKQLTIPMILKNLNPQIMTDLKAILAQEKIIESVSCTTQQILKQEKPLWALVGNWMVENEATLVITLKDKGKKVIHFKAVDSMINALLRAFNPEAVQFDVTDLGKIAGVKISHAFERNEVPAIDWGKPNKENTQIKYDKIYAKNRIKRDYIHIHQNIENEVVSYLTHLLKNLPQRPIKLNLIDAGCGKSTLLRQLCRVINDKFHSDIELRHFGFDPQAKNIEFLSDRIPDGHYLVGDICQSESMIAQAVQNNWLFKKENEPDNTVHSLMLASGVLTHKVLPIQNAIKALQSIWHARIDALICSGENNATFNENIAKRLGMTLTRLQNDLFHIYLLQPLPVRLMYERRIASFIQNRTSKLDLSLCSDPFYILCHLDEEIRSLVKTLDLSFCRPTEVTPKLLRSLPRAYPNLQTILFYQSEKSDLIAYDNIMPNEVTLKAEIPEKTWEKYDEVEHRECEIRIFNAVYFMPEKTLKRVYDVSLNESSTEISNENSSSSLPLNNDIVRVNRDLEMKRADSEQTESVEPDKLLNDRSGYFLSKLGQFRTNKPRIDGSIAQDLSFNP